MTAGSGRAGLVPARLRPSWPGSGAAPAEPAGFRRGSGRTGRVPACDASIVPVVSGHVDPAILDRLAAALLGENVPPGSSRLPGLVLPGSPGLPCSRPAPSAIASGRAMVLRHAADLLSGPAGLAAFLRTGLLDGPAASISLPLDVGRATEEIPAHLRRAVILRDKGCGFPGCTLPPEACQVHHLIPRSQGGPTRLDSLILGCTFHHLIVVHRWGWQLILNPDGTRTAISPDGQRVLHSHSPPARAA
jgi:hypothetical protein